MKIIDRYILKNFLYILFFSILAFIVIYITTNLIEKLGDFLDKQIPTKIIVLYYIYFIPEIIKEILPVSMLMASLFSVSQISRHRELIAMKSSGLSLFRILMPIIIFSLFISIFSFFFNEIFVPYTNRLKFDIDRVYLLKLPPAELTERSNISIQDSEERITNVGYFDGEKLIAYNINIQIKKGNTITERADAKMMKWTNNKWIFYNGVFRNFKNEKEEVKIFSQLTDYQLNIKPDDLSAIQIKPDEMNYMELKRFIKKLNNLGGDTINWSIDLNEKLAFPLSSFIIVLFGISFASKGWRGGTAKGFGISLLICFLYYGINISLGPILGQKNILQPALAAWLGNIIFGGLGIFTFIHARK
jgi:lipopolysaccharide export system permease protein